ncbi:MAG: hypothetical protein ACKO45_14910 [Cyanobium sp.]
MADYKKLKKNGVTLGWQVTFSHNEVQDIVRGLTTASQLAAAAGAPGRVVSVVAGIGAQIFGTTDAVGGNNGVDVIFIFATGAPVVVPKGSADINPADVPDEIIPDWAR